MNYFLKWKSAYEGESGRLPTAYLFSGPEGSGRRETALEIARTLLGRIDNHPDFVRIIPDRRELKSGEVSQSGPRSIRIETIRDVIRRVSMKPFEGDRVVILMEEMELIIPAAANALLKTLEEPPAHVLFILVTSAPDRLPSTIRSRCQTVMFQAEPGKLQEKFNGLWAEWRETLTPLFAGSNRPFSQASSLAEPLAKETDKLPGLIQLMKALWRDGIVFKQSGSLSPVVPDGTTTLQSHLKRRDVAKLMEEADLINETERAIEGNVNKMLALERLFVKLVS